MNLKHMSVSQWKKNLEKGDYFISITKSSKSNDPQNWCSSDSCDKISFLLFTSCKSSDPPEEGLSCEKDECASHIFQGFKSSLVPLKLQNVHGWSFCGSLQGMIGANVLCKAWFIYMYLLGRKNISILTHKTGSWSLLGVLFKIFWQASDPFIQKLPPPPPEQSLPGNSDPLKVATTIASLHYLL